MKTLSVVVVVGLSLLIGCAGVDVGDEADGPAETEGVTSEALGIGVGGGGLGASGGLNAWCKERADCIDKCDRDYTTSSTRSFCKKTFCPKCASKAVLSFQ